MRQQTKKLASSSQLSHYAGLSFLGLILLQGFHEVEHVVQVFQHFVFNNPKGAGLLGTWVDIEPVHVAYNGAFLLLIGLCFWVGGFAGELARRRPITFWLMTFALAFEGYHFVEHIFKIVQFIDTGKNGTPGILGRFFNLVWLHLSYNTIAYAPLVLVFFIDGYSRRATATLSSIMRLGRPGLRGI
jgi:hypothetical protein